MIGSVAIKGDEIFFSETICKPNLGPCKYPLENWLTSLGIFIPFCTSGVDAISALLHQIENDAVILNDKTTLCGILICENRKVREIATVNNKIVLRSVPYGVGSIYTRGIELGHEDALYAAIKLKDNFKEAIDLASENCISISSDSIFTTVSIVAYAAYKKDPGLIRTTTNSDMNKILKHENERLEAIQNE